MLKAVIFDVDGTLVDSNDQHVDAWKRAFEHFGVQITRDQIRSQVGKGGDQLLPALLTKEQNEKFGKDLGKYKEELFQREYMASVQAFPQVRELFEHLRAQGLRIALATSAKGPDLEANQKKANIEDLVEHTTDKSEVAHSKPAPDVFAAALEKLNIDADEAIAVGDTPYDAQACNKIHLRTIGFTCGGWNADELKRAGCIEIYRDSTELLEKFHASALDEGTAAA